MQDFPLAAVQDKETEKLLRETTLGKPIFVSAGFCSEITEPLARGQFKSKR